MLAGDLKVFVLADSRYAYARRVAQGVCDYASRQPRWHVSTGSVPPVEQLVDLSQRCAGMIGFFSDRQSLAAAREASIPVINFSASAVDSPIPRVRPDNREAGRKAARHLLDAGYKHFAYGGATSVGFSIDRHAGFAEVIGDQVHRDPGTSIERHAWLRDLPKPVGILAESDERGLRLIDHATEAHLIVPEQIGICGVDNDDFYAAASTVGLTSIDTRGYAVGQRAAELLGQLIDGAPRPEEDILVPVGRVVQRLSTETAAIDDPDLAFVMKFIRERACETLRVDEIVEHLSMSRRTLEKRFRAAFGRSVHEQIRRVQFDKAEQLLLETDLPIVEVAAHAGFNDRIRFTTMFRQRFGQPPGRYRKLRRTQ